MQCSKKDRYSITSSARDSSDGGIVIPSAFAVLLLITQLEPCCLSQRQIGRPSAIQDLCDLLGRSCKFRMWSRRTT